MIRDCTRIHQAERLDFALAAKEIFEIEKSILNQNEIDNPEIFAEEIMALLPISEPYYWSGGAAGGQVKFRRGLDVSIRPDFRTAEVILELTYVDQGLQAYAELARRIDGALDGGVKALEKNSWRIIEKRRGGSQVVVKGAAELGTCQREFEVITKGASEAYKHFEEIMPK